MADLSTTSAGSGYRRIKLLNVPIDILPEQDIENTIRNFLDSKGKYQIMFLTLWDLLRARGDNDLARAVKQAGLVIPVSKSIQAGARFLGKGEPVRYMPFSFVIKLLGVLEKHKGSIYLVGLRPADLQKAAGNLRDSFPGLQILGRYAGYFSPEREKDVVLVIKKSAPSLVLAGPGVRRNRLWFHMHRDELPDGLSLWCGECFDIFCGRRNKPAEKSWNRGTYWMRDVIRRPWVILRIFYYSYYLLLLLIARIRKA
ncbi:MAG: WecB/TagA/CpsF family glycosyltransferase [Spirochaetota bacterium]|nr:WecB/TagA/CpsF family glycosyltransferase [Spirochaetota bacterium]